MILIADKSKITTEGHDEFLDIVDYLLFNNTLVYICNVTNSNFLCIDEIEQIFILEHVDSLDGIAIVLDGCAKV